ncbi:hypothetical protein NQ176_g7446 [Zarea fungicola]|uniref:Uncharacterized protein n=1 Tax=Zarea fungicola TaxID=93591 RepID=A0ACC1MZY2_9HYPO|nr:hypothetical protein NQ176_g7446 [Lecanicillium fungicola]
MPSFSRLVRFLSRDGRTYYGDAILREGDSDISKAQTARIIKGDIFGKHEVTSQVSEIHRLLPPLAPAHSGTVRCLGLNYADHAKENNLPEPKYPVLFFKPPTSLSGPTDPIPIPHMAQEMDGLDYECELVIVVGKQCKDVSVSDALDYVLGYAVGNDLSHRDWQLKHNQWGHGKGFDGWAPYGPGIVSSELIKDPQSLAIWTKVNGEILQNGNTANQIFGVKETISLLSRGVTLMPGDLIFTGTPAGVGMGRSPQLWLKDGDVVEVGLDHVGTCINRVEFAREYARI